MICSIEYSIRECFVSRDVIFYIHVFPYQRVQDTNNKTNNPNIHSPSTCFESAITSHSCTL